MNKENNAAIATLNIAIEGYFDTKQFDQSLGLLQEMKYRERVQIRLDEKMELLSKLI